MIKHTTCIFNVYAMQPIVLQFLICSQYYSN